MANSIKVNLLDKLNIIWMTVDKISSTTGIPKSTLSACISKAAGCIHTLRDKNDKRKKYINTSDFKREYPYSFIVEQKEIIKEPTRKVKTHNGMPEECWYCCLRDRRVDDKIVCLEGCKTGLNEMVRRSS